MKKAEIIQKLDLNDFIKFVSFFGCLIKKARLFDSKTPGFLSLPLDRFRQISAMIGQRNLSA
jgi:hypothetical protein